MLKYWANKGGHMLGYYSNRINVKKVEISYHFMVLRDYSKLKSICDT